MSAAQHAACGCGSAAARSSTRPGLPTLDCTRLACAALQGAKAGGQGRQAGGHKRSSRCCSAAVHVVWRASRRCVRATHGSRARACMLLAARPTARTYMLPRGHACATRRGRGSGSAVRRAARHQARRRGGRVGVWRAGAERSRRRSDAAAHVCAACMMTMVRSWLGPSDAGFGGCCSACMAASEQLLVADLCWPSSTCCTPGRQLCLWRVRLRILQLLFIWPQCCSPSPTRQEAVAGQNCTSCARPECAPALMADADRDSKSNREL